MSTSKTLARAGLFFLTLGASTLLADRLAPYEGAPPEVSLTESERQTVAKGDPVYKQVQAGDGGRAAAVFRVNAPAKTIWSVISSFNSYPEWISGVKETEVYKRLGEKIFVRFKLSQWPVTVNYYIEHNAPMERLGWLTWKLDYSKQNDLEDSVGFWRVTPVPGDSSKCDVSYSVEVRLKGWVPDFIKNMIIDRGLKDATQWVKKQSEARTR